MEEKLPSSIGQNDKIINILLLGETGVGKKTFINSFVNYLQHTTLINAHTSKLLCLIPLKFTVSNEDYEDKLVEFNPDNVKEEPDSSSQGIKSYLFPFEQYTVRLIDTPGFGDSRGIEQDYKNFENVLAYISQYEHLQGICFLLKSNVSVINEFFKLCIVHLLSRLGNSVAKNILFVFTNSRNTFYRPGETLTLLKAILKEIKEESPTQVDVPCSRQNMFCVDNEAIRFLIAKKDGIIFDDDEIKEFEKSWKTSYKACRDILGYFCGTDEIQPLQPDDLEISVNEGATEEEVPNTSSTSQNDTEINMLLLGERGVGKSMFINSFVNYLEHTTLNKALASKLACLIPMKFTVSNENYEDQIIEFGRKEDTELSSFETQGAKDYVFSFGQYTIRLIDTPGIGDDRGIDQDDKHFKNILAFISQYKHLHGICFLLKSNVTVINDYFKFCIIHLLSRVEKSVAKNITFVFTNSRGTFYRPGEALPLLKGILKEIKEMPPHVDVLCSRKNMFCVDNEAIRFLIAKKNGIMFDDDETEEFAKSWKMSYKACREILACICGAAENQPAQPHVPENANVVQKVQKIITALATPLAEICDLIEDNLTVLKTHNKVIQEETLSKVDLMSKLYIPTIELKVKQLNHPVTVCTASKCSEIYMVGELKKYHYKQRCHDPCGLNNIPKEIVGHAELKGCAAMNSNTYCNKCRCHYSVHMHIYYELQVLHSKREDLLIKMTIETKEDEIKAKQLITQALIDTIEEYEYEKKEIFKWLAKFAHFLKENSISSKDAYIDYLDYLIQREKLLGDKMDQKRIENLTSRKSRYEEEKRSFDVLLQYSDLQNIELKIVNGSNITTIVDCLFKLKHTGPKIAYMYSMQQ